MAVEWMLQEVMRAQGIRNASQLEAALAGKLGIQISRTALDKLLKKAPVQIRLETVQYLCTLFQVPLEHLLCVTPEPVIRQPIPIQPFVKQKKPEASLIVDPSQFF
jgi:putative transcriptional regulator